MQINKFGKYMDKKFFDNEDKSTSLLCIHYETDEHYIALEDFVSNANSINTILNHFARDLYGSKIQAQLYILPSEDGSFLKKLLWVIGGTFAAIQSPIGSNYIEGLTGKSPEEWAKETGENNRQSLIEYKHTHMAAKIAVECTKGFLSKPYESLGKVGLDIEGHQIAYEARNDFYNQCESNEKIKGIGFDDSDRFPVKREDFQSYIITIPLKLEEDDHWYVDIVDLKVTSPNWERGDNRHWKAKSSDNKSIWFVIEDEYFWGLVHTDGLGIKIFDNMRVQLAYIITPAGKTHAKALKVIEYNGYKISDPLSDYELESLLNSHEVVTNDQFDLFS